MRGTNFITSPLLIFLLFFSCSNESTEVESLVSEFAEAMKKPVNFKKMESLYRDFKFTQIHKVEDYNIVKTQKNGANYKTTVSTSWVDESGKTIKNYIDFYINNTGEKWKILDSKGILDLVGMDKNAYVLGIKTGCIVNAKLLTDQKLLQEVTKSKKLLTSLSQTYASNLSKQFKVENLKWTPGGRLLEGNLINGSSNPIREIGFLANFLNRDGQQIGKHSGLIGGTPAQAIKVNEPFHFVTKPPIIPKKTKEIQVQFFINPNDLQQAIVEADYKGDECHTVVK